LDKPNDTPRFRVRPPSPGRGTLLGLGLLALIALVAAVSRAHHTPGGHSGVHTPPRGVGDYLFSISFVVLAALFLAAVWLWFSARDILAERRRQRRGPFRLLFFLAFLGLVAALGSHSGLRIGNGANPPTKANRAQRAKADAEKVKSEQEAPRFKWLPLFVATSAGLFVLGIVGVRAIRRSRRGLLESFLLEQEFQSLVEDTLADLHGEKDPRKAIIAAYARVERLFGTYGLSRAASEAPIEYLERVLPELRASGAALRRLTALFQWAKFSAHEVDRTMRDEAIEALVQVRDELRQNRIEDEQKRAEAERLVSPRVPIGREPT
jgi:hypothetical protein